MSRVAGLLISIIVLFVTVNESICQIFEEREEVKPYLEYFSSNRRLSIRNVEIRNRVTTEIYNMFQVRYIKRGGEIISLLLAPELKGKAKFKNFSWSRVNSTNLACEVSLNSGASEIHIYNFGNLMDGRGSSEKPVHILKNDIDNYSSPFWFNSSADYIALIAEDKNSGIFRILTYNIEKKRFERYGDIENITKTRNSISDISLTFDDSYLVYLEYVGFGNTIKVAGLKTNAGIYDVFSNEEKKPENISTVLCRPEGKNDFIYAMGNSLYLYRINEKKINKIPVITGVDLKRKFNWEEEKKGSNVFESIVYRPVEVPEVADIRDISRYLEIKNIYEGGEALGGKYQDEWQFTADVRESGILDKVVKNSFFAVLLGNVVLSFIK